MIIDIGLMVGSYIFTRMFQTIIKREKEAYVIVQIFAAITILLTVILCMDLIMHSGQGLAALK